jgi:hypothetical protein
VVDSVLAKRSAESLAWILHGDWIVILLIRREKFIAALRADLFSEHCFGSISQTFLENLTRLRLR